MRLPVGLRSGVNWISQQPYGSPCWLIHVVKNHWERIINSLLFYNSSFGLRPMWGGGPERGAGAKARRRGESQCESASGRERISAFLLPSGLGISVSARSTAFATSGRERIRLFCSLLDWGRGPESIGRRERETFQNVVYEMWLSWGCGGYGFAAGSFENRLARVIMPLMRLECGLH